MYVGIDLGGTNIAVGLVDGNAKLIDKCLTPTLSERAPSALADDMIALIRRLFKKNNCDISDLKGIGIGSPGIVDDDTGSIIYAANLNADGFSFSEYIKKHINVPVHIANDADCAALGEYVSNGVKAKSFVLVTLGTGVGGGVVLDGKLYGGSNKVSCELGHMTLVSGGEKCSCGKRGCFEAYASVTALKRQTRRAMDKNPTSLMHKFLNSRGEVSGKTAFQAARAGDKAAAEVVKRYVTYAADGIVSIENIFQPDFIVIGGGISKEGDNLLNPIKEYVEKYRFNKHTKQTKIKIASLFNDAGIVGAAMLCR